MNFKRPQRCGGTSDANLDGKLLKYAFYLSQLIFYFSPPPTPADIHSGEAAAGGLDEPVMTL